MEQAKVQRGCVIRSLLVMYISSGLLLMLLTVVVSRVEKEDMVAQIGIIVIYVFSCGMGGFIIGKWKKRQKFLYALTLFVVALAIQKGTMPSLPHILTAAAICIGSSMLGGMLS